MLRQYQALFFSFVIHSTLLITAFYLYQREPTPVKHQERCIVSLSQYNSQACETKPIVKKSPTHTPKKVLAKAEPLKPKLQKPIVKPVTKKQLPKKPAAYVIPLSKPEMKEPVAKVEPISEVQEKVIEPEVKVADVIPAEEKRPVVAAASSEEYTAEPTPYPIKTPEQSYMDEHLALIVSLLQKNLYYPRIARRRGITGEVMISFELTKEGKVKNAAVISGKYAVLNRAAMTTLERLYGELPHPTEHLSLQVPIHYRLR